LVAIDVDIQVKVTVSLKRVAPEVLGLDSKEIPSEPLAKRQKLSEIDESTIALTDAYEVCKELTDEQAAAWKKFLAGESGFITGSAGTGKSRFISRLIGFLQRIHGKERVFVTALTGNAAYAIGGSTINAFAGIGMGGEPAPILIDNLRTRGMKAARRWRNAKVLIVDEVSMLHANLFDKLVAIARELNGKNSSFGGIQLILCGDFYQLPPVEKGQYGKGESKDGKAKIIKEKKEKGKPKFCFESPLWKEIIGDNTFIFSKQYRQDGDTEFADILNNARVGETQFYEYYSLCESIGRKWPTVDGESDFSVTLFPHRKACEDYNIKKLKELPGKLEIFMAKDDGEGYNFTNTLNSFCQAPQELQLRVGAQVVLVKNLNVQEGLANGTRGEVVDFEIVRESDIKRQREQAIELMKKTSSTISTSKEGGNLAEESKKVGVLKQETLESSLDKTKAAVLLFVPKIEEPPKEDKIISIKPVVLFENGTRRILDRERWEIVAGGAILASRYQFPLTLAWGLTIHKAQGMTLKRLRVDLTRVFEPGMAYVALSRATSLQGLSIEGKFSKGVIRADPKVVEFYKNVMERMERLKNGNADGEEEEKKQYLSGDDDPDIDFDF